MGHWVQEMKLLEEKADTLAMVNPVMLSSINVYLLKKYVDDLFTASGGLRRGTKWDQKSKAFIWDPELDKLDTRSESHITLEEFAKMASGIFGFLNFTWDTPDKNSNKKNASLRLSTLARSTKKRKRNFTWILPKCPKTHPEIYLIPL